MTLVLSAIFLLSGAAALIFETLWFRQAGLTLGNSVWASSMVTASFMGGLALGNGLAARHGDRLRRPLLAYAGLEAVTGVVGIGLVVLFPTLPPWLAPVLGRMQGHPGTLNAFRLLSAFALMLVPATAMGATLPLLVRAVSARGADFGRALGLLYGWNTLGAVAGALLGELVLIERLGIRGTGLLAGFLDGLAALGAVALWRWSGFGTTLESTETPTTRLGRPEMLLVAATFLCGAILLALEIVWFRFLLLFVFGTSIVFVTMLSVVLFGIGAGGLVASAWLKWQRDAPRYLPPIALAAGLTASQTYIGLSGFLPGNGKQVADALHTLQPAVYLMLPTSFLSGILFTFLGRSLKEGTPGETRTAGVLTLANTSGAMFGALLAGFVLLPYLGMERSFLILAAAYGAVALLIAAARWPSGKGARRHIQIYGLAATLFVGLLAFFPLGLMRNHYLRVVMARWPHASQLVAAREGLTETVLYLRQDLWGEPFSYRLVTNGFSMSGTWFSSRRYMGLFAYLPLAIQPQAKRALLISYGVGNTAKALTDTRSLESIDIVDISRDILDLSRLIFPPNECPLDDPRVRVHVEDGRFFLLTAITTYDLITAEPPPPKGAGIVNLYSREYFHLIHDRLAQGGVVSYWLPVYQLTPRDARAIIRAFCDAFEDCTLWSGFGGEWILVGTRGAQGSVAEGDFTRQWRDPVVGPAMRAVGLEVPEQLGALFLADSVQLTELTQGVPPLDDDHPQRLSSHFAPDYEFFVSLAASGSARERFAQSDFIRRLWPPVLRERSLPFFGQLEPLNRYAWATHGGKPAGLRELRAALSSPELKGPALWLMDSSEDVLQVARRIAARGAVGSGLDMAFGAEAMANHDYLAAERRFRDAQRRTSGRERLGQWRTLALCLAGQTEKAKEIVVAANEWIEPQDPDGWAWLSRICGLPNPFPPPDTRAR